MRDLKLVFALLLLGSVGSPQALAAESYDTCTGFIDSIPATITTQGAWCLRKDLASSASSGSLITINANNVMIDCNDFKVGGLAAGASTWATAINSLDHSNIAVRRCNIRGFWTGVSLQGSGGRHVVEDNRLDGTTTWGIWVEGMDPPCDATS